MKIIRYQEQYKQLFIDMNKNWINKLFKIEQHDLEQLDQVENYLEQGAMAFFAVENEQVLATCMVLRLEHNTWEICKFTTNEQFQGKGAGTKVFQACLDYAIENQADKIVLYSNKKLKPALHIYQKFGFKEVPVTIDDYESGRCDYQAELTVSDFLKNRE